MDTRSPELARACEAVELAASRSRYAAMSPDALAATGAGARPLGAGQIAWAATDAPTFNMVLGLGVAEPAVEREIDEALEVFAAHGTRRCMFSLAPIARPPEIEGWLQARGFSRHNHWIRLAHDLSAAPAPRTDLRIAAFDHEHADPYSHMTCEAFRFPLELAPMLSCVVGREGWRHFGAFDGGELVAAGALFVEDGAAWLGAAATRESHRGRGAQSALIAARLEAAREAGARFAAVETAADTPEKPNPSTHNLRRLGFRDLYERGNWVKVLREA